MRHIKYYLFPFVCFVVSACFVACSSDDDNSNPQPTIDPVEENKTETGSELFVMQGLVDPVKGYNSLKPSGYTDALYLESSSLKGNNYAFQTTTQSRLDQMGQPDTEGTWAETGAVAAQKSYWVRHKEGTLFRYLKLRIVQILDNNVLLEYKTTDITSELPVEKNVNANEPVEGKQWLTDLAMPHLSADLYYVEHTQKVGSDEVLNYAYAWNSSMKHAAWSAFYFDATTSKDVTKRTDAWDVDSSLPKEMQTDNSFHTNDGFDRGHIIASEDRVYSEEANKQTFYFSNMSPQFNSFNGIYWQKFERTVQTWGRSGQYDKLYVAKGGTLNHLLKSFTATKKGNDGVYPSTDENGFTVKGLACPQYYYIAVLGVKGDTYQAIGFKVEHRDDYSYDKVDNVPVADVKKCAFSIDELEEFTGIDFFCNLPDGVENEVEKSYSLDAWSW